MTGRRVFPKWEHSRSCHEGKDIMTSDMQLYVVPKTDLLLQTIQLYQSTAWLSGSRLDFPYRNHQFGAIWGSRVMKLTEIQLLLQKLRKNLVSAQVLVLQLLTNRWTTCGLNCEMHSTPQSKYVVHLQVSEEQGIHHKVQSRVQTFAFPDSKNVPVPVPVPVQPEIRLTP